MDFYNRIFKGFIFVSFLLLSIFNYSQKSLEEYTFKSINENIGQKAITSFIEDHEGFIWMSTVGDGLKKYNGVDFINYKREWNESNSINSSRVYCVYIDSNDQIWAGTDEGLNLYDRELNRFIHISLYNLEEKTPIPVYAIEENNNKELLVGTHEFGLFNVNIVSKSCESISYAGHRSSEILQINAIQRTERGAMLVGTNFGLMVYNRSEQKLEIAKFETLKGLESITFSIESILMTDNENIWLGTSFNGLVEISSTPTNHYKFSNHDITDKRILSLAKTSAGNILCGTENDGLFVLDKEGVVLKNYRHDKIIKNGIKSNSIWSVFVDNQERIWLGYYNNGVDVYDPRASKFKSIESLPYLPQSLYSSSVTGISKDKEGRFWIGMFDGGVDVYNPKTKEFIHLLNENNPIAKGLESNDVQTIFIDSKENVWIGTWSSGIYLLRNNTKEFENITVGNSNKVLRSNRIMSFSEDSKGVIWFGTFLGGLYSYNPKINSYQHYGSSSFKNSDYNFNYIRKVLIDSEDNVWVGTITGLYKIIRTKDSKFTVVSLNDKMDESSFEISGTEAVLSVLEDRNKNIWVGTESHGLFKYKPSNDSIYWYQKENNRIHQSVSSIVEAENGNIWISENLGLSEFDIEKNSFTNYSSKDGLLSNSFNNNAVLRDHDGTIYLGNYKGINYFNPKDIEKNPLKPTVYFSNLKLKNKIVTTETENSPLKKSISETDKLVLNHDQSVFTIEYVGVNYTRTENNHYAYYLEGLEDDWNYMENTRSATYTNIPQGNYIFKVKSANNDGLWNDIPTVLHIQVLPPWWKTKIAIMIYALLVLLITYLVSKFFSERIRERRLLILEREERKQTEVLNAKKIQFFTNISHEFRTPLTLILNPLEDLIEDESLSLSEDVTNKHISIHKNTKRLSRMIDELMDFRKLQFNKMRVNASRIEVNSFIYKVVSHFEMEATQRNIVLSVDSEESNILVWADESMLEKIIFNILSNAFKATPNNGMVHIEVRNLNEPILLPLLDEVNPVQAIEICIEDTGSGIKQENLEKIFERFYQAKEMDKQYYGGTGIGLEVVRSFVDLHKGKIEVESEVNSGTHFKIYLPLGKSHFQDNEITSSNHTEVVEASQNEGIHKKVLLIVEDNTELRTYLKNELENHYKILEAENGKIGFEIANKVIPDLIITDVMMPIMNGYELCEKIKQTLKTSHIPLLMLTAKGLESDRVKGIDLGADVYMNKPFNMKVLRSHLKQLVISRQILFNKYFNGISDNNITEKTTSLDKEFITKVLEYIHKNIGDNKLNVENLADELFLSRSKLYRKIKALTGYSANEFLRKIRLEKAKQLILTTDDTMSEICYKVGFSSPSYFTKCFKNYFNVLPTEIKPNKNDEGSE